MKSVLFVASVKAKSQDWADFLSRVQTKLAPSTDAQRYTESCVRLAENVWLLDLTKSVDPLGWLAGIAQATGVQYGVLSLDYPPQWLPADFEPQEWK